jgi:uncharacterized protein YggE
MKRVILTALLGAIVLAASPACGGGNGNGGEEVRTQQGLPVAFAAHAGASAQERASSVTGATPEAPQPPGFAKSADGASEVAAQAVTEGLAGLTVAGYGLASVDADSAILELYFSTGAVVRPAPGGGDESQSQTTETGPIAEADLRPVIDAIVAQGVDRDDIEFLGGSYYDPSYGSATLRVTVRNLDTLGMIIQAATDAAAGLSNIVLQGSYVSYTISDCGALEQDALRAAAEDAGKRADALARALGVSRGSIAGALNYAYSPFGGTPCDTGNVGPYPIGGITYTEGQARQVQLYATVTVTYALR